MTESGEEGAGGFVLLFHSTHHRSYLAGLGGQRSRRDRRHGRHHPPRRLHARAGLGPESVQYVGALERVDFAGRHRGGGVMVMMIMLLGGYDLAYER